MYGDYGTFLRLNKKSSDYLEKKQKLKIMFMKN